MKNLLASTLTEEILRYAQNDDSLLNVTLNLVSGSCDISFDLRDSGSTAGMTYFLTCHSERAEGNEEFPGIDFDRRASSVWLEWRG